MTITKIIAAATVSCALFAGPAFAQSSATKAEDYAKDKVATEAKDMAADKAPDNAMMIKGDPLTVETPSAIIVADDAEMILEDGNTILNADKVTSKSKMEAPNMMEAPAAVTSVTIACPEGTTAQNDGTCMITGDYKE